MKVVEAAKELEVKYYIEPTGLNENQVTVVGRRVKKEGRATNPYRTGNTQDTRREWRRPQGGRKSARCGSDSLESWRAYRSW